MPESPNVFVVDPDVKSREQVIRIAREMGIHAQQFSNAESFLASKSAARPGCLVSEFRLLGMNGIDLQESLAADRTIMPVIFVAEHAETPLTVRAMRNGAVTVLEKPISEQALWDAIRSGLSLDKTIRRVHARHDERRRRMARLTEKERRVLELLVKGKTNKAIAGRLDVSVRTVENRRKQIFRKTGTDSVAQLVRFIIQSGESDNE